MKLNVSKTAALVLTIVGICIFALVFVHAFLYSPQSNIPIPAQAQTVLVKNTAVNDYPTDVIIPKINVDAKVQDVGMGANNTIGVPNNFTDVAWYDYSVAPGQTGNAIIDGHVDDGLALPAVFANLGDLQKGDSIYIENASGNEEHFVVKSLMTYPFTASAGFLFAPTSLNQLSLITCAGTWSSIFGTHDKRLVVTAVLAK